MSFIRKHSKMLLVAGSCAALGAGASAIATAGAATGNSGAAGKARPGHVGTGHAGHLRAGRGLARRAVHGQVIVPSKTGFVTVMFDRGTVKSVSGQQLTLTEGTKKATYKTVTLTIPADAHVRDNRQKSTLADVTAGQRATVVHTPTATFVIAHTRR
jgi:hypothetical protein